MGTWSNLGLQDANSPIMEQLIMFHDHAMMILVMITILVAYMMITLMFNKIINRNLLEGQTIELIWTIVPAITLIFIALPSLRILYLMDEVNNPLITVKAIGHQWYWSYEYSDFKNIEFDSYMKPSNELELEEFRLLDVDNRVILPMKTPVRILVTSGDVIHSWTIPSIGIKIDGTPGRLNQGSFTLMRPGVLFGQCSEICGANHSFMPIAVESVSTECFLDWMKNY
uniref:cytochrome c oxidase subunit II n=1 Tax=Catamiarus brevipennis TaxID=1348906 RepID=UPI0022F2DCBB|nr:cytochrome c oxidase subunit II [Catamiarus brevipennis]WAJ48483.1 cytochrome c oxidase subunit 2 [Catamiarus brevipennis]